MKKDLTNPLVIISFFLIIVFLLLFIYYYFIKPIENNNIKEKIVLEEANELELLTKAYLNQNSELNISELFFDVNLNQFAVASEYAYLKNGKDFLDKYDETLNIAKNIFDDKKVKFDNFVINLDECGKEKYSSLEGFIYQDTCDLSGIIYEIKDIYKKKDLYIVEFYASLAKEKLIKSKSECSDGKILSYNLNLKNLENYEYENNDYIKCSDNYDYGIFYLKNEIINKMKTNNYIYKLEFKKNKQNFTFYDLKK